MLQINIDGPDGNSFVLLGYARQFSRDLEMDSANITKEMMEGDYNHLLSVFDKYFKDYVKLISENQELNNILVDV